MIFSFCNSSCSAIVPKEVHRQQHNHQLQHLEYQLAHLNNFLYQADQGEIYCCMIAVLILTDLNRTSLL